jgi:hypothetical protein
MANMVRKREWGSFGDASRVIMARDVEWKGGGKGDKNKRSESKEIIIR